MAACTLASCGRIEEAPANEPETIEEPAAQQIAFTATLAAKGEDPQSKAITTGTEGGKEVLNVSWAADEQIAVYYQTGAESYDTAIATVESVDAMTGEATITATLTGAIDGGAAKFVYPATLVNKTGDIDESKLLNQNGNLTGANGISTKFDAAKGTGTITIKGLEASIGSTVTMTNQVCICKFRFDVVDSAGGAVGLEREFSPIIIRDGNGHTYTITSDRTDDMFGTPRGFKRSDDIYIALLPVSGKTVSFYTKYSNHYLYTSSNTTLTAGKFYRNLSIDMVKDESGQSDKYRDLRDGSITANDGDIIYQRVNTSATDKTITIPDGATVTLAGVNISATGSAGIICSGTAIINIEGANTVTAVTENYPAVQVGPTDKTLTIQGSGSLTATGALSGAGIGGVKHINCGNIVIIGGTITAKGGDYAAGIGSGQGYVLGGVLKGSCGTITINAGTIVSTGGHAGAGIGSGFYSKYGSIVISDGVTSITATSGYEAQAPIGKGNQDQGSGSVTVDGVANWSGAETTHLNWTVSTVKNGAFDVPRWTLTYK